MTVTQSAYIVYMQWIAECKPNLVWYLSIFKIFNIAIWYIFSYIEGFIFMQTSEKKVYKVDHSPYVFDFGVP